MNLASRLLSTSMVLSLTLLLGRLAGFVREIQLGAVLGVSRDADFAIVMLTTPDLLVNLLLAGGLSAALIPEFARLDRGGRSRLFLSATAMVAGLFGLIGLLVAVFPSALIFAFAPGYLSTPTIEYGRPFAIAALAIPLAGLAGVTSALLNAEGKFFVAGGGTLIFNIVIIAMLATWSSPGQELLVLAIAITLAATLRYGSQILATTPYLSTERGQIQPATLGKLTARFLQALSASTLVLLIPVMLRAIVSLGGAGNIAAYNFATKLVELPVGIAITTISAVAFPALSKMVAAGDTAAARLLFGDGVRRGLSLAIAIAIPCIWFAYPLVVLVFGHGRMTAGDLALISELAQLGFLTLPMVAISSMATALLNARHQTGLLLKVTLGCILLVPVAVAPGIITGDARLTMAALPLFHLVFAFSLATAAGQPVFQGWRWALFDVLRPAILSVVITAVCSLLDSLIATDSNLDSPALALVAVAASVLAVGTITRRALAT